MARVSPVPAVLPGSCGPKVAGDWFLWFWRGFAVGGGGLLFFLLLAVVRVGKDGVSFSLLVLRLKFLKQNSPQKCNTGTHHRIPSREQPTAHKYAHCQTREGKRCLLFCLACIFHNIPSSFFSVFACCSPPCQCSVKRTEQRYSFSEDSRMSASYPLTAQE